MAKTNVSAIELPTPRGKYDYASLEEAFPAAEPGVKPAGNRVLVQIRTPKSKSSGGIVFVEDTKDTELWNTQVAKVVSLGEVAFKNRDNLEPWPEGDWCKPGDFVRVAKYAGDRWQVTLPSGEKALFMVAKDLDIIGVVTGDPLAIVAYI